MDSWDKAGLWEEVRESPEYQDGRLTEKQAARVVEDLYANQEKIRADFLRSEISREMVRMLNRGEAEYDPETGKYSHSPPR